MDEALFQVGQKALIKNKNNKILAVKQEDRHWPGLELYDFPGGRVNEGENDLELALKRELREELKVEIDVHDLLSLSIDKNIRPGKKPIVLAIYHCSIISGIPDTSGDDDVIGYDWINIDDLAHADRARYGKALIDRIKNEIDID